MMAVNSLTPNMPRFDTLQKSQHSTAYRARQLVRGHRQLRSQSCSEHPMANNLILYILYQRGLAVQTSLIHNQLALGYVHLNVQ